MNRQTAHTSLVNACVTYLRAIGIMAHPNHTRAVYDPKCGCWRKMRGGKGAPDVVGAIPPNGRYLGVECKTGTGALTRDQREFCRDTMAHGGLYMIARTVDDLFVLKEKIEEA